MDPIALGAWRGGRAIGNANGKEPVRVAVESVVADRLALGAADALNSGNHFAVSSVFEAFDTTDGKDVDVFGQFDAGRPGIGRIDSATGPVDLDPVLGQPPELFVEKNDGPRSDTIEIDDIASQQQRIGAFGECGLEYLLGSEKRGFEEKLAQLRGDLSDTA